MIKRIIKEIIIKVCAKSLHFLGWSKRMRGFLVVFCLAGHNRTMVSYMRLKNLKRWCLYFREKEVSFVECGVAKGGCLALMKAFSNNNKQVWGFDSFEGIPALTEEDEGSGGGMGWL